MILINPNQIQSLQYDEHVTACLKNEKDVQNHTSKNKIKNGHQSIITSILNRGAP